MHCPHQRVNFQESDTECLQSRGQTGTQTDRKRPVLSRQTRVPTQSAGPSQTAHIEVGGGNEHVKQCCVNTASLSTRVAPPATASPMRRKSWSMCVNDLTIQHSKENETLMPSAESDSWPCKPAQTARQTDQQRTVRPISVQFDQVKPDLSELI